MAVQEFSTIPLSKNTNLDTNGWECLHGSPGAQQRSSSTLLGQKHPRLDPLKTMKGTVSFYVCHPTPKVAQLSASRYLAHDFFHGGKWECVIEHLTFPALWYTARKAHFFLTPSRILSRKLDNLGVDSCAGRRAAKIGNGTSQRGVDPINCSGDSLRKPTHEPLGTPPLPIPQLAHGHLWAPHSSPKRVPTLWLPPCAQPWGQEWYVWVFANG